MRRQWIAWCLIGGIVAWMAGDVPSPAGADEKFPTHPITLLVGFGAGSGADMSLRYLAHSASKKLKQPMVVVNKEGASGSLALSELKTLPPDGYTISFFSTSAVIGAHVQKLPFDPRRDFEPIIDYAATQYGISVKADSQFKTMEDVITYARANPGVVKAATIGAFSPQNLVLTQLGEAAKVKWVNVPFASGMTIVSAVLGGHVLFSLQAGEWKPFVKSGKLRLLAVFTEKRLKDFPNVPTLVDLGYPIVGLQVWAVVGPKGMPKDRVQIIHDALREGMQEPGFAEVTDKFGLEPQYRDPSGLQKRIEEIYEKSGEIIKTLQPDKKTLQSEKK